jgi:predicted O-methyltransferase YrrM
MFILVKLKEYFRETYKSNLELRHHSKKNDDVYALSLLQSLLNNYPYVPFTSTGMRPVVLAYILNEIVVNSRRDIIEFGSGISTILMARLIRKNNLRAKVYSVEHDPLWIKKLGKLLSEEDLLDLVHFIEAPLEEIETDMGSLNWYSKKNIFSEIEGAKFDLVIVDGPPAHSSKSRFSRYPAFGEIISYLKDDCCLILDDIDRPGEKIIVEMLSEKFPEYHSWILSETMMVLHSKPGFDPTPLYY